MASAARLYTPEVLALAASLADWPLQDDLPLIASARSAVCGSELTVALRCDAAGRIAALGLRARACAIGQAAAALFARSAVGHDAANLAAAEAALAAWLQGASPPGWPGIEALSAARAVPGRHGAIRLGWQAARAALASAAAAG